VHVIVTDDSWIADPSGDSMYAGILKSWLDAESDRRQRQPIVDILAITK
jgi:hypothetical protein